MLGNFTYCNPTKLYFGEQSLEGLHKELPKYGDRVVLIYGGGSIKRNGIYDAVRAILDQEGKQVAEIAGVMPNPTLAKLYEGIGVARAHRADLLLAVGGGSVCDYAKAVVCLGPLSTEDPWEKYYLRFEESRMPHPAGGLCAHHGGHWLRDERRLGHHPTRPDAAEDRPCLRQTRR